MPSVVVVFHFRTEDLWLREELLGSASRIEREGNTVWIHFPSQEFDYGVKPTPPQTAWPLAHTLKTSAVNASLPLCDWSRCP